MIISDLDMGNGRSIKWGAKVQEVINNSSPLILTSNNKIELQWERINLLGIEFEGKTIFKPEETKVKERTFNEIQLTGTAGEKEFTLICAAVTEEVGAATATFDVLNINSCVWEFNTLNIQASLIKGKSIRLVIKHDFS